MVAANYLFLIRFICVLLLICARRPFLLLLFLLLFFLYLLLLLSELPRTGAGHLPSAVPLQHQRCLALLDKALASDVRS